MDSRAVILEPRSDVSTPETTVVRCFMVVCPTQSSYKQAACQSSAQDEPPSARMQQLCVQRQLALPITAGQMYPDLLGLPVSCSPDLMLDSFFQLAKNQKRTFSGTYFLWLHLLFSTGSLAGLCKSPVLRRKQTSYMALGELIMICFGNPHDAIG